MTCDGCGGVFRTPAAQCAECGQCRNCCECLGGAEYDADELGLDPEEPYDA